MYTALLAAKKKKVKNVSDKYGHSVLYEKMILDTLKLLGSLKITLAVGKQKKKTLDSRRRYFTKSVELFLGIVAAAHLLYQTVSPHFITFVSSMMAHYNCILSIY